MKKTADRVQVATHLAPELMGRVKQRAFELQLSLREVHEQALEQWLETTDGKAEEAADVREAYAN